MKCPKCGRVAPHIVRQCPEVKGEPVCISCCYKCESWNGVRCLWHVSHPAPDYRGEIFKLKNKIKQKQELAEHYYKRNKPWISERIIEEIKILNAKRWELEQLNEKQIFND